MGSPHVARLDPPWLALPHFRGQEAAWGTHWHEFLRVKRCSLGKISRSTQVRGELAGSTSRTGLWGLWQSQVVSIGRNFGQALSTWEGVADMARRPRPRLWGGDFALGDARGGHRGSAASQPPSLSDARLRSSQMATAGEERDSGIIFWSCPIPLECKALVRFSMQEVG